MVQSIIILGGGSAGLIAALSLHAKLPDIPITVVRSLAMGVIGVGEGTTHAVPAYFHQTLGLNRAEFFRAVDPSYKRGVRFLWGPRDHYDYGFGNSLALKLQGLSKPFGYYCDEDFSHTNPIASLMAQGRFFLRGADGNPVNDAFFGYHFENARLVDYLESAAAARGITLLDDELAEAPMDDTGVLELRLASGRSMRSDLYVDASGFCSELLGRALGERFVSFKSSLFCERAVVGGWERTVEPVLPYTISETMEAGWCWQIEHRTRIRSGEATCTRRNSSPMPKPKRSSAARTPRSPRPAWSSSSPAAGKRLGSRMSSPWATRLASSNRWRLRLWRWSVNKAKIWQGAWRKTTVHPPPRPWRFTTAPQPPRGT